MTHLVIILYEKKLIKIKLTDNIFINVYLLFLGIFYNAFTSYAGTVAHTFRYEEAHAQVFGTKIFAFGYERKEIYIYI